LGRFFLPHTIHAEDCGTVVDGNACTLTAKGHYHLRTVAVSFEPFLDTGSPAHDALMKLLRNPTDKGIRTFQGVMHEISGLPERPDAQASLPVRQPHLTLATGSEVVHKGDGSKVHVTTHYVIERTELPICELLATDRSLVTGLVTAICEDEPGQANDAFAHTALRSAGHIDDLALLQHSAELHGATASVRGLFGIAAVKSAAAVLVGSGNKLQVDMRVDRSRPTMGGGLADLDRIRELAAPVLAERAVAVAAPAHPEPSDSAPDDLVRLLIERHVTPKPTETRPTRRLGPPGAIG
jgi:hypothetical protein